MHGGLNSAEGPRGGPGDQGFHAEGQGPGAPRGGPGGQGLQVEGPGSKKKPAKGGPAADP